MQASPLFIKTMYTVIVLSSTFLVAAHLHVSLFILFSKFIFSINPSLWQKCDLLALGEAAYKQKEMFLS